MFHSPRAPVVAGFCLLAALAILPGVPTQAQTCDCSQASLLGTTVSTSLGGPPQFTVNSLVGPGVELPTAGTAPNNLGVAGNSPRWSIDFGVNTIRIDFITMPATYGTNLSFTFGNLNPQPPAGCAGTPSVVGMTVTTNKTTAPFVSTGATFGPHQVTVPFGPPSGNIDWNPGEFILITLKFACDGVTPPPAGLLKVCKVAGTGITVGTPFNFTISTSASHAVLSVPAGPAPGGTCMIGPSYPVGTQVDVTEAPTPGVTVSSITVAPPGQVVNTNLAGQGVTVSIGNGVTEVTYTDQRTGFLEICKRGDVKGSYSFTVNPGALGPFVVPAGACSPAIEVAAGSVTIHEQTAGVDIIACSTIPPAAQQAICNTPPGSQSSVVTVVPGDISTMTIAFITNRPKP
jgi:hypothetical protein